MHEYVVDIINEFLGNPTFTDREKGRFSWVKNDYTLAVSVSRRRHDSKVVYDYYILNPDGDIHGSRNRITLVQLIDNVKWFLREVQPEEVKQGYSLKTKIHDAVIRDTGMHAFKSVREMKSRRRDVILNTILKHQRGVLAMRSVNFEKECLCQVSKRYAESAL